MNKSRGVLVAVVVLAIAGAIAWWLHARKPTTTAPVATPSSTTTPNAQAPTAARAGAAAPAHVTVTVRDANGPLAGATVRVSQDSGEVSTVQTGADGVATSEPLEAGPVTISASATGHEPAALAPRDLRAGETIRVELTLVAGGRLLTGTVTDVSGGPIAGARIDAAKMNDMMRPTDAIASTLTGADGKYSVTVAEGQLLVAASNPSYAAQSRFVDVGPAGAVASFALVPGGVIEGVVREEATREPVPGAVVRGSRDTPSLALGDSSTKRTVAGADGRFRLAGLRPGAYRLEATAGPRVSRSPTIVGIGVAEEVTDAEILVGRAATVRGTVVDDAGAPAPNVNVSLFSSDASADATADAKGAFVVEGVPAGRYRVIADGDSYLPGNATAVEVTGADVNGVVVHVHKALTIKGHVEPRQVCDVTLDSADDNPRSMRAVFSAGGTHATAADGAFELGPLDEAVYIVRAHCASGAYGKQRVQVAAALPEVIVTVKPGATVTGKVVDKAGRPASTVTVSASPIDEGEHTTIVNGVITSGVRTLTASDGTYTVRGLAPGEYRLAVYDRGTPLPILGGAEKVKLAEAEQKSGVDITVESGRPDGTIRGTVVGADGKPIADAWVSTHISIEDMLAETQKGASSRSVVRVQASGDSEDYNDSGAILTDAAGQFTLTGLARVPMTVTAEAQAGALRGQVSKVTPDATITINAVGLTELRGTVHAPQNAALTWFTVELEGAAHQQRTFAGSGSTGAFSFARVDPGDYKVTITSSAGSGEAQVKVEAGKPASVDVTLASNAIVVGTLVDAQGKPIGGIPVVVVPDTGEHFQIRIEGPPEGTRPDGSFRVETKPGLSIVVAMTGGGAPTLKRGVMLEAGKTTNIGQLTVSNPSPGGTP